MLGGAQGEGFHLGIWGTQLSPADLAWRGNRRISSASSQTRAFFRIRHARRPENRSPQHVYRARALGAREPREHDRRGWKRQEQKLLPGSDLYAETLFSPPQEFVTNVLKGTPNPKEQGNNQQSAARLGHTAPCEPRAAT